MERERWETFVRRWIDRCSQDDELAGFQRGVEFSFVVACGPHRVLLRMDREGGIGYQIGTTADDSWDFSLIAEDWVWQRYWQPEPPPLFHSLFAMQARVPEFRIEGSIERFSQMASAVRRIMEAPRLLESSPSPQPSQDEFVEGIEPIVGRYVNLAIDGEHHRIYFEQSGEGPDLLLLHTAGADSRQYRHLMCAPELRQDWRMTAFDLPLHGRSLPPDGAAVGEYGLTTESYVATILRFVEATGLVHPVVIGSSMAGEICLELAYRHPDAFRAVVACEAADHVGGRQIGWSKHPGVNQATFVPEWIYGLMAPNSPRREEVWWGYSQGGYGVFHGDIHFYSGDWDARDRVGRIDTSRCPVYMLTGEYDYSCRPEDSKRTADKIPGARFQVMQGLGHFPMTENPGLFLHYLLPVLGEVKGTRIEE